MSFPKAIVKFNSHTQARDKIYRTVQYGSRFALWYLSQQTGHSRLEEKLQKLEAALALSRKLFRMGNCLELSQKALEALSTPHHLMRLLGVSAQGFKAIWLILDHIIWFGKVDIIQINHATWNKWSSWSWLIALASATILDLIKLTRLQAKVEAEMLQQKSAGSHPEVLSQFKIEKHNMQLTFWRDFCDLFIPLSSLHYANSGLGAFCGLLSSLIGFQQEWEKHVHPFKPK